MDFYWGFEPLNFLFIVIKTNTTVLNDFRNVSIEWDVVNHSRPRCQSLISVYFWKRKYIGGQLWPTVNSGITPTTGLIDEVPYRGPPNPKECCNPDLRYPLVGFFSRSLSGIVWSVASESSAYSRKTGIICVGMSLCPGGLKFPSFSLRWQSTPLSFQEVIVVGVHLNLYIDTSGNLLC